jgi:maltose O-acetyltransferase
MSDANSRRAYYWRRLRARYARMEDDRRLRQRFPTCTLEENVRVVSPHLLELGDNVSVQRNSVLHCGGLDWSDGRGRIDIGSNSIISANSTLWGAGEIELGEGFECGPGCMIFSSAQDFMTREAEPVSAPLFFRPVKAGRYVSVYSGAIISPGVTLGDGAVVGAGAVVVSDVPSREFWGGIPARRIRSLSPWDD